MYERKINRQKLGLHFTPMRVSVICLHIKFWVLLLEGVFPSTSRLQNIFIGIYVQFFDLERNINIFHTCSGTPRALLIFNTTTGQFFENECFSLNFYNEVWNVSYYLFFYTLVYDFCLSRRTVLCLYLLSLKC